MSQIRLAELLGRLSLPCDFANGSAPGKAIRSTVLTVELGRRAGVSDEELRDAFWLTLLGHLGGLCGARDAGLRANEDRSRTASSACLGEIVAAQTPLLTALEQMREGSVGSRTTEVETKVMPLRLHEVGQLAETAYQLAGSRASLDVLRLRQGVAVDGRLVEIFFAEQGSLFAALEAPSIFERFLEIEPGPLEWADDRRLDDVAHALAVLIDGRCPLFSDHSTGVAALAVRAAGELGLGVEETRALRLGALLHDIGRVSVPNAVWMRPGALDWAAWESVRLHAHYTAQVLAPIPELADVADIASAAHERLDGSGYPQRRSARTLSTAARVLAAAHSAVAMREDRPHRPALTAEATARELVAEVAAGRLDRKAVDAVLASLGLPDRAAPANVHGLSERELEVSQFLARGQSDREIAVALRISPRTVQVHVSSILEKLGARNRTSAAVWLIEHDLCAAPLSRAQLNVLYGAAPSS